MSDFKFECLKCHGNIYKKWALPNLILLHWVLNPGVALGELIFGQCIPKETYICTGCKIPFMERTYVYCPSCSSFHNGMIWGKKNGFGHWFGLICPKCGLLIPRLWNLTSILILSLTLPIWWIPVQLYKEKWLQYERDRVSLEIDKLNIPKQPIHWYRLGIGWGITCWLLGSLTMPLFVHLNSYIEDVKFHATFLPLWLIGGLLFGFFMKRKMMKIN